MGAWKARAEGGDRGTCVVRTRLRNPDLLAQALGDLGAEVQVDGGAVTGRFGTTEVSFQPQEDGSVVAHVVGADAADAERLVLEVDDAYASAVQAALYERLLERAPALGLRLERESVDDQNAITLVLVQEST